jgi:PGF-CTERM protein
VDEMSTQQTTDQRSPGTGRWVWALLVASALLVGLALLAGPVTAQTDQPNVTTGANTTVPDDLVASSSPDPPSDRLGWENGVWYNATLNVTQSDGIQSAELRALTARTMARIEQIRGLEFDRTPPVRLITRDQQRAESEDRANFTSTEATRLNVGYEALLLINETTDAVDSQQALVGSGVGAYYSPATGNITMISPRNGTLRIQENVLSQELFHAQQDQQFNVSNEYETIEDRNAALGVIEGDANYVQYLYEQRCDDAWEGTCYVAERQGQPSIPPALNIGMYQLFLQPYNSGVDFVRDRHRQRGWEAVNTLYQRLPASTEQTIHPPTYPEDVPPNLTVSDRSSDAWTTLTSDGERVTATYGEAGLYVSLVYPALETQGRSQVIPVRSHVNIDRTTGQLRRPVAYNYSSPLTTGWDGDRLVPYRSTASGSNETAYVYETAWDSEAEAREFADGYRELLGYHNADPVDGRADTFRIPENTEFADAFYVNRSGTRVTIVNAPTVEGLSAIRPGAAPQVPNGSDGSDSDDGDDGDDGENTDATGTPTADATPTETNGTASPTPGASGPGFGIVAAVLALVTLLGVTHRR